MDQASYGMASQIEIDRNALAGICGRHRVARLSLFGSALRPDFGSESDIDLLVEFEPGSTPGLSFFALEHELAALFGRKVDLVTPNFLSRYFRDDVMNKAEPLYVSG